MPRYTEKQGKYLAFIYYYGKIHGYSPSEAELQSYFGVTPPTVHQMVLTLERNGLIERTPEGEQLVTRISEGMTEWRCDGRTGYGLSEYLDQIIDGKPVGAMA